MSKTPFDPWDWLGVHCGGFLIETDDCIREVLETLLETGEVVSLLRRDVTGRVLTQLICTLLCNTDAFEFEDNPTQMRFVGDERFKTLDALIDAWDDWYEEHYG